MTSLRRRLNRVLLVLFCGLLLLWFVADRTIVYVAEAGMESRLRHDADMLAASLELRAGRIRYDSRAPGTIYASAYSGHYYVVGTAEQQIHSASFGEAPPFDPPRGAAESLDHVAGPNGQPLLVLTTLAAVGGQPIRLSLGEDLSALKRDLARFRRRFLALLVVAVAGAMALQARELRWMMRKLESTRQALTRVQKDGTRIRTTDAPVEIRPLADDINGLLAVVDRRLEQSRTAVGNLSHALKMPLAAAFRLLDDPRLASAPDLKRLMHEQARTIQFRIERELRRARLAGGTRPAAMFAPHTELPALVQVLEQIYQDRRLCIAWTAPASTMPFDRHDVVELVGNLADNACKWARAQVRIEIRDGDSLEVIVSDDGAGCSIEHLDSLGTRGQRLDESIPGHGFGLAIARDIVEGTGGRLSFARSETLGGLQVSAHLPRRQKSTTL